MARKLPWDILALASRGLSGFVPWHGSGLLYVMGIYIGAQNTTGDLHGTIIQTDSIFVANNTYLAIVFDKNKTFISTVTQDQYYSTEWVPASYRKVQIQVFIKYVLI